MAAIIIKIDRVAVKSEKIYEELAECISILATDERFCGMTF